MANEHSTHPEPIPINQVDLIAAVGDFHQAFNELSSIFDTIRRGTDADFISLAAAGRRIAEDLAAQSDLIFERINGGGIKQ